jgi:hypothetical protein
MKARKLPLTKRLRVLHEIQDRKRKRYPLGMHSHTIDTMRGRLGNPSPRPLSPTASSRYDIHNLEK